MPITASAMRLIMRQIQEMEANPTDGIRIYPTDDLSELLFELTGPEETPFADGLFNVVLHFEDGYPEVPPRGVFRTKIFHPNVAEKGDICVNVLKRDWNPALGLRHVLTVIRCLLIEPNPESALNEEAGRLLLEDYEAYRRKAAMITKVHAKRAGKMPTTRQASSGEGLEAHEKEPQQEHNDTRDVSSPVDEANAGLRNASNSEVNRRDAGGNSANAVSTAPSKKAVEKKRAALKRI